MIRHMHFRVVGVAATLIGAIGASAQIDFSLDTSFQTPIVQENVNAIAVLNDGSILAAGRIRFAGDEYDRGSTRILQDGQPDLSFPWNVASVKITPWLDRYYAQIGATVRRLLPNGLFDPDFSSMNADPLFQTTGGQDFHAFPDGRVVVSGDHNLYDTVRGFVGVYNWVYFTNTGRLDTTRIHRQASFPTGRFTALPNGQFICHGQGSSFDGQTVDKLFKLNADGSVDTSFQSGVYWGVVKSYATLADNRFYAGGSFMTDQLPGDSITIARFRPDGSLDPSFAIPEFDLGELTQTFGPQVFKIVPLPNGNIIAAGKFQYVNGQPRGGICLLDSNGVLLDAFANATVGTYVYMNYEYTSISDVVIDSTNNYLYLCGAYVGYSDGTTSDPTQRFVTRLHLGDIMTGTAEGGDNVLGLHVYPNPSRGLITLRANGPDLEDPLLIVRDMAGREVQRERLGNLVMGIPQELNLDLPAGLYHIMVQHGKGVFSTSMVLE